MDLRELESFRLEDAVKFHDSLNPQIWGPDEHMLPAVRERLLAIADDFRESLGIDVEVKDITISGSNAAYTYTPHSDIDLHLVTDLPQADASDVYRELFDAKKYQYNDEHDFRIGPYDVELYVQDASKPHYSQGIYSILDDKWLSVPKRRKTEVNDISVRSKYEDMGARIDTAIESGDLSRMDALAKKIRDMRQTGLETTGEFGPENLAFKVLRNNGTLNKLKQARLAAKDREMSLNERKKKRGGKKKKWGVFGGYYYPGFGYYGSGSGEGSADGGGGDGGGESVRESREMDLGTLLKDFVKFCSTQLGLEDAPRIRIKRDPQWSRANNTFGRYVPEEHTLYLSVANRHPLDIMRTMAHELTHHRQAEVEPMPDHAGETGSRFENQANAMAGIIMRKWADLHPDMFDQPITENGGDEDTGDFPNQSGGKMPGDPIPYPKGTVKVDVSDVYDWYKLGQHISDLKGLGHHDFGKGPPQTVLSFGSEPVEHKYIQDLAKLGLTTTDIDESLRGRLGAAAAAACIAGTPGCATTDITATDALRGVQAVGRAAQATKPYGTASRADVIRAGAEEELRQELKNLLRRSHGMQEADEPVMKMDDPIVNYDVPYSAIARPERLHQVRRFGRISHYGSPTASSAIISVPVSKEPQFQATMRNLMIPVKKSAVYEASGYIPTAKEKNDPRYKMALTVDVKPGQTGREANKLGLKTDSQGRPQLLMKRLANMLEETKLDEKCWKGYRRQGMKRKGRRMVPNCVPVAEDFDGSREYRGLVMSVAEGEDGFKLTAHSPAGKKLGWVEFSYDTDGMIRAEELEVDERYRGQGIARTMYDYAKSLGFTIRRSSEQTPDGAAFWDKNRPGEKIWEHALTEDQFVYRIDSKRIPDFSKDMKTYYHNADYTMSGRTWFPQAKGKSQGVYAQDRLFTALYATGGSSGRSPTRYVATYNTQPPTVYFNRADADRLKNNRSYLTVFDARNFRRLPSGEWFSDDPGRPVQQKLITDPFQYIQDTGWRVEIVDDLRPVLKRIQDLAKTKNIKYGAEGMGYERITEDQDLFEVKMSPTALEQWAKSDEAAGIQAGFEAELIFRGTNRDDDQESEPDYDADERADSIEGVIDFFQGGENGIGRNTANRLRDGLYEEWGDWREEAIQAAWEADEEDHVLAWMEENVWAEDKDLYRERAAEALGIDLDAAEPSAEQTQAIEAQAREEFERDVATTIEEQDDDYQRAREEFRDDAADNDPDYDEESFLQEKYRYMSDIADAFSLDWPYWTEGSSGGDGRSQEDIADSLSRALGGAEVKAGGGYHSTTRRPGRWIVEPDGSLDPDDYEDAGLEIVSPPMPLPQALESLRTVIDWANGPGDAYTNGSTGLHMGVSIPYKGGDVDYVKLILFMGDQYVLDQFDRAANSYTRSALEKLQDVQRSRRRVREAEGSMTGAEKTAAAMDLMRKNLIELAQRYVQDGVGKDKYTSAHIKPGYIEFRSPGGDYLSMDSRDEQSLGNTMLRFARAMQIAGRPDLERKEYSKKLYKLLSGFRSAELKKSRKDTRYRTEIETEGENDALELFAKYSAGLISPEILKKEWARQVLAKEQPEKTEQEYEIYNKDTGETLETLKFERGKENEGMASMTIANAVEKYAEKGIPIGLRQTGEPAVEPSRRAKVAKRIQQTPAQAADNRRDSQQLQQRMTGEFPYRVMWSENGREDSLNTTARSAQAAEDNITTVLDAMGRRPDPGSVRAVPRAPAGYERGLSQQDQPQAQAGRTDWQEYQIYDANTRETVVGFMAASDDEALARLERHRASRPGQQFGVRVAHAEPRQSEPAQPQGEWTGRWLIKDAQGQVLHTFAGIGNVQADANRHAARWLSQSGFDDPIEVVPEMV